MSFFLRGKQKDRTNAANTKKSGGVKRSKTSGGAPGKNNSQPKKKRFTNANDIIDSDSDIENKDEAYSSSEEEEIETEQEKRLRLAKQYLTDLKTYEDDIQDNEAVLADPIAHRLKQDVLAQKGRLHKDVALSVCEPTENDISIYRGHKLPVTCLVVSSNSKHIFSAGKECSIIKWDIATGNRLCKVNGCKNKEEENQRSHSAHILCLAISTDNRFLASGDRNKVIHIWKPDTLEFIHTLTGHREAVSGLAFRTGTHQLFSASHDKTVKVWSLDEMAYVETLFGHQDVITGIDCLARERVVTSGGRDASVRIWKIMEESQLVFNGHASSIDCIALVNEETIVSGSDDNCLCLWGVMKKKPLCTVKEAHNSGVEKENWITAVAAMQYTDLIASAGSKDGKIRLWKCESKTIKPVMSIPVTGFVNALKFSADGNYLVAGVGQEHRLGRWWRHKDAKNCIVVIKLNTKS